MKTEIKLNSQLVIIETPNTSASPGLVGCQCESGLAPESDTSTAVEHQCEASCSACLVCLPALCCIGKPHTCTSTTLHLLGRRVGHVTRTHPSLPASMLVTRSSHRHSSSWMSIGPHVVQTNQHRRKQWFAFCQFEAEEEDSHCSYRGEPMTQETTKKISFG